MIVVPSAEAEHVFISQNAGGRRARGAGHGKASGAGLQAHQGQRSWAAARPYSRNRPHLVLHDAPGSARLQSRLTAAATPAKTPCRRGGPAKRAAPSNLSVGGKAVQ